MEFKFSGSAREWAAIMQFNDQAVSSKLDTIIQMAQSSQQREIDMAVDFTNLQSEVASLTGIVESVDALLDGLSDQVAQALADDGVEQSVIDNVTDSIASAKASLAASVAENTPANPGDDEEPSNGGDETPVDDGGDEEVPTEPEV